MTSTTAFYFFFLIICLQTIQSAYGACETDDECTIICRSKGSKGTDAYIAGQCLKDELFNKCKCHMFGNDCGIAPKDSGIIYNPSCQTDDECEKRCKADKYVKYSMGRCHEPEERKQSNYCICSASSYQCKFKLMKEDILE